MGSLKSKKLKKQSPSIFEFCFWEDQSTGPQPIQLVPSPFNWSPKTVFYRYLSIGRSNQKKSKNLVHLFSNFDSGRTTQLVPNPFNWSPKTVFYRNLSIGRSNKKNLINLVHLFSNFDSGRTRQLVPNPFNWSPTHSTGPQKLFFTESSVLVAQIQKFKKLSPFIFEF